MLKRCDQHREWHHSISILLIFCLILGVFSPGMKENTIKAATGTSSDSTSAESKATSTTAPTSSPAAKATAVASKNTLVVKKKKCSYPTNLKEGQAFTVVGTLKANRKMKKVVTKIVDDEGNQAYSATKKIRSKKFNLKKVDAEMKFSKLTAGTYSYRVSVKDVLGNKKVVLKKKFDVTGYGNGQWMWPVEGGQLGCGFQCPCSVHNGKHYGIDIKGVSVGTDIKAINGGKVVYAQYHVAAKALSFGNLVILYHGDGMYSFYAHCSKIKCSVGDEVESGDVIASVGATGCAYGAHLHLEIRKGPVFNLSYNNSILMDKTTYVQQDPMSYLG